MRSGRTLKVIDGTGVPLGLSRDAAPRLRPGEYPVWFEVPLSPLERSQLRNRARRHRVGTDAFVSIGLEYCQLSAAFETERLAELVYIATNELEKPTIGFAPELHAWQRLLGGQAEPADDELPAICIPLRIVSPIPVPLRMAKIAAATCTDDSDAAAALKLEAAAARRGMTMMHWALLADRAARAHSD